MNLLIGLAHHHQKLPSCSYRHLVPRAALSPRTKVEALLKLSVLERRASFCPPLWGGGSDGLGTVRLIVPPLPPLSVG